jgi:glycosyltransferase involved in cell wall biosynthesis
MKRPIVAVACRNNPASPGGIEAVVRELVPRLAQMYPQWDVRAVWAFERQAGLARIPLLGDLIAAVRIAWRARQSDVAIVHGAEYAWPFVVRRESTVIVWHGTRAGEVPALVARMSLAVRAYRTIEVCLQRFALRCARQVAVAPGVVEELRAAYGWSGEVDVITNGGGEHARIAERTEDASAFRVLWIGVQAYKKGWDVALQACRIARERVPQLRLVAAGLRTDAPAEPWIEWLGAVAHERVLREYASADVLLATTRYEACSMAIIEALAHGVPVAASPAVAWMVQRGGVRVAHDDAAAFAQALEALARDRARLRELRSGTAHDAAQFRWSEAAAAYGRIIARVFAQRPDDSARRAAS